MKACPFSSGERLRATRPGRLRPAHMAGCLCILLLCFSCMRRDEEPAALMAGAAWVTHDAPPSMAAAVSRYEQVQSFGLPGNPHGWRVLTRYTLRSDAAGPDAGCSFTGWIAGHWKATASTIVVTPLSAESGSLEMHDCPDHRAFRTMPRPPIFVRAESSYRLEGNMLHLTRQFGAEPAYEVTLTRVN